MEELKHNSEIGIIGPPGITGPPGVLCDNPGMPCDDPEILAMINNELDTLRKKLYPTKRKITISIFERIMRFIKE